MQEGSTPLHYCAGWGIPIVCLYLLEQGADNRIRNMVRLPAHGTAVPGELRCPCIPDMTLCVIAPLLQRDDSAEDVARRLSRADNADLIARWVMSLPKRPVDPHPPPPIEPPVPDPTQELVTQLQGLKVKTDALGPWHVALIPTL